LLGLSCAIVYNYALYLYRFTHYYEPTHSVFKASKSEKKSIGSPAMNLRLAGAKENPFTILEYRRQAAGFARWF
jgi:hypothetical protein